MTRPPDLTVTIERAHAQTPVGSLCTGTRRIDTGHGLHGLCGGCFRSRAEIKHFKSMDNDAKRVVLDALIDHRVRLSYAP